MADFIYIMPESTHLHKGEEKPRDFEKCWFTDKTHAWFAEQKEVASSYGLHVYTFATVEPLKLINISSPLFHMDFIGKVNLLYRENGGNDNRKGLALMPLGLPSTKESRRVLASLGIDDTFTNFNDQNDQVNNFVSYFNGKHRMSILINGNKLDDKFMDALKQIYGATFDGYIQPIRAPSAIFGGGFNNQEVGIFNPHLKLRLITDQRGGGKQPKSLHVPNFITSVDTSWIFDKTFWKTGKVPSNAPKSFHPKQTLPTFINSNQ